MCFHVWSQDKNNVHNINIRTQTLLFFCTSDQSPAQKQAVESIKLRKLWGHTRTHKPDRILRGLRATWLLSFACDPIRKSSHRQRHYRWLLDIYDPHKNVFLHHYARLYRANGIVYNTGWTQVVVMHATCTHSSSLCCIRHIVIVIVLSLICRLDLRMSGSHSKTISRERIRCFASKLWAYEYFSVDSDFKICNWQQLPHLVVLFYDVFITGNRESCSHPLVERTDCVAYIFSELPALHTSEYKNRHYKWVE